jgi:hypothetical protein
VEGAKMFDETPFSEDDETLIKVEDFIEEFDFENLVFYFYYRKINQKVSLLKVKPNLEANLLISWMIFKKIII